MVQVEKDVFSKFNEQKRLLFYSTLRGKTLKLSPRTVRSIR